MKRLVLMFRLALLPLILAVLLSCLGMGAAEYAPPEPSTSKEEGSSPPGGGEPEASVSGARGGVSEAEDTTAWSEESEALALAETPSAEKTIGSGTAGSSAASSGGPQASGLKAGFADDNKQFNYFVQFIAEYGPAVNHIPIPVEERIILKVRDSEGNSIPNAGIRVSGAQGQELTGSDLCGWFVSAVSRRVRR